MIIEHVKSMIKGRWTKNRLLVAIILWRQRQARGGTFTGEFYVMFRDSAIFTPMIFTLNSVLHTNIPLWIGIVGILMNYIVTYTLGYYDETKLKLWQKEQEVTTTRWNPFWKRNEKQWVEIHTKIDSVIERLDRIERGRRNKVRHDG